jgi:hypothetical protein
MLGTSFLRLRTLPVRSVFGNTHEREHGLSLPLGPGELRNARARGTEGREPLPGPGPSRRACRRRRGSRRRPHGPRLDRRRRARGAGGAALARLRRQHQSRPGKGRDLHRGCRRAAHDPHRRPLRRGPDERSGRKSRRLPHRHRQRQLDLPGTRSHPRAARSRLPPLRTAGAPAGPGRRGAAGTRGRDEGAGDEGRQQGDLGTGRQDDRGGLGEHELRPANADRSAAADDDGRAGRALVRRARPRLPARRANLRRRPRLQVDHLQRRQRQPPADAQPEGRGPNRDRRPLCRLRQVLGEEARPLHPLRLLLLLDEEADQGIELDADQPPSSTRRPRRKSRSASEWTSSNARSYSARASS